MIKHMKKEAAEKGKQIWIDKQDKAKMI